MASNKLDKNYFSPEPVFAGKKTPLGMAGFDNIRDTIDHLQNPILNELLLDLKKEIYPVGSLYISTLSTNPATLLGFGTWGVFGAGKVLVSLDSGDTDFDTSEETGGAKTKTIATANLPNISTGAGTAHNHGITDSGHTHIIASRTGAGGGGNRFAHGDTVSPTDDTDGTNSATTGITINNESAHTHSLGGSGTALNVMNPYIVVHMWKRTA